MNHFKFQITVDTGNRLVRILISGTLERSEFARMIKLARGHAHRHGLNLLYDMRSMDLPADLSLTEILNFVCNHQSLRDTETLGIRSASLVVQELLGEEIWDIYRYASRTAGLEWQFFTEEQSALDWLA